MRRLRSRWVGLAMALGASMTLTLGLALAQDRLPEPDPKGAAAKDKDKDEKKDPKGKGAAKGKRRGPVAPAGAPPKKGRRPEARDPLGKNAEPVPEATAKPKADPNVPPTWPFHYKLKVAGGDGAPLAAAYYPAKGRFNPPAVMLVHDRGAGHAGKDWQEPLEELKGASLAEALQEQGYAVLVPDLRFHGANQPRRDPTPAEWRAMPADLQAMYLFLVDRHNRGELNLSKLGVIADGESANLVAAWAAMPGAAVSSEGRVGDLSALVLISPVADASGMKLASALPPIAPRIPIHLICGDRDQSSIAVVKAAQPIVERHLKSKVSYFDTNIHGSRLVKFFPKVPAAITKFLDDPVKGRVIEWEPRYLLTPVAYQSEGTVEAKKAGEAKKAEPEKMAEPAKKAGD